MKGRKNEALQLRDKILPLFTLGLLTLNGCATIMTGTSETVSINTEPTGAKVELSNGASCTTPCTLKVKKKTPLQVTIRKKGCATHTTALIPTISGSGAILGGLIDYGTGAVYHHQPNPLFVSLNCSSSRAKK